MDLDPLEEWEQHEMAAVGSIDHLRRESVSIDEVPRDTGTWSASRINHRPRFISAVRNQLRIIEECREGENLRQGLERTPERVARMWLDELTSGYEVDVEELFAVFSDHESYNGMIVVKDIPVTSQCEHHLVPFVGYAHIGYFPDDLVLGLSKLPRVVDAYARRLQIQERLTQQILNALQDNLEPRGVIVVIEAEHLCMTLRGIQKPGTKTMTSAVSGLFRDPKEYARQEFFSLAGLSNH